MLYFTADTDWAPEEVIADLLGVFVEHQVKCTVFATHPSSTLASAPPELFEIGIHPNFEPLLKGDGDGDYTSVVAALKHAYPDAAGVRSHTLTQSTTLLNCFRENGLEYDGNQMEPYSRTLAPFVIWNGLVRIPFNWEDDVHFMFGRPYDDSGLDLATPEVFNVVNFHPVHVFLNTENASRYLDARPHYHDPKRRGQHRNTSIPGTRDLLVSLLRRARETGERPQHLWEVAARYREEA